MIQTLARQPGTIQQTETQRDPYRARPEDFRVRAYSDPIAEPFHGQGRNDAEAEKRSREAFKRGLLRSPSNVFDHLVPSGLPIAHGED